ncbi:MAG TPA: hypothetical protein VK858_11675 [Longimicrobiales bacterium]|nr:hypothetical protein [Longimicrobiales bacterium]
MLPSVRRTVRFAREWYRPLPGLEATEVQLPAPGGDLPATRFRPVGAPPLPGWILLHGITRPGRRHVGLIRFARSLAAGGATVLVPEIAAWVEMDLAPQQALAAAQAGVDHLHGNPQVVGRPGLMGFSFGAPQALRVAGDPSLRDRLGAVAGFGGYGDLGRTVRFLFTGAHEWEGVWHRTRPDPYGRWIVTANYLTRVPGFETFGGVADALRRLAGVAGDRQIESWDPALDAVKTELAAPLSAEEAELFRVFAPEARFDPPEPGPVTEAWARRLSEAARDAAPLLTVPHELDLPMPVFLLHGRHDHLIPFTETLRLAPRIRAPRVTTTITGLFGHSAGDPRPRTPGTWARELWHLGRAVTELLAVV